MNGSGASKSFTIFTVMLLCVRNGNGFLCYYCHQTSPECNNGILDTAHQKNCSVNSCITMKYETHMPSKPVLATIRDCASSTDGELMRMVSSDAKRHTKLVKFNVCNSSLCNSAHQKRAICTDAFTLFVLVYLFVN